MTIPSQGGFPGLVALGETPMAGHLLPVIKENHTQVTQNLIISSVKQTVED